MKKLLIILFCCFLSNIGLCQNNVLYLIFDADEPKIEKDISKYKLTNEPVIVRVGSIKAEQWSYIYTYPLVAGSSLILDKKPNTTVQTIPLSQAANYPAKTIAQLDAEMQPLVQYDFDYAGDNPYERKTFRYFLRLNKFYVIELDKPNQLAYIVEVDFDKR